VFARVAESAREVLDHTTIADSLAEELLAEEGDTAPELARL
jgi:hypothetical protein